MSGILKFMFVPHNSVTGFMCNKWNSPRWKGINSAIECSSFLLGLLTPSFNLVHSSLMIMCIICKKMLKLVFLSRWECVPLCSKKSITSLCIEYQCWEFIFMLFRPWNVFIFTVFASQFTDANVKAKKEQSKTSLRTLSNIYSVYFKS